MNTVFIVMEKSPNGTRVSRVFENKWEAGEYLYDCESVSYQRKGEDQYWIEEWEEV